MTITSPSRSVKLLILFLVIPSAVAGQTAPLRKDIPAIAKAANGAIVTIITAANDKPVAQGTGFVVSANGVIVTNYHVIATGNVAVVKFPDGTVLTVDGVLAADKVRDLAIIKIHGKSFRTLTLGNSDHIQVGEEVVAIGNPLGLELTVSNGILSAVRTDKEEGGKLLQVTAPISPGSSGGPLFNMAGEVIGITTLFLKGGENLNFSIPINDAKRLLSNQPTKLQNLPNEAEETSKDTSEEPHVEATPAQEQICNERATKFVHYKRAQYGADKPRVEQTSHYDIKLGICLVENGFYFVEGNKYPSGRSYDSWIDIDNAFSEGSGGEIYGHFSFESGRCKIKPPNAQEISCRSKEEFDDLALKYFGIAERLPESVTKIAESIPDFEHASPEQNWKDVAYCHQHPHNFLQFLGKEDLLSCMYLNSDFEEMARRCKSPQSAKTEHCESFLLNFAKFVAGGSLPPNTKISAMPAEGLPTWEQYWEDVKYCYQNPTNNLQGADGTLSSCGDLIAKTEKRKQDCQSKNHKDNRETCKNLLKLQRP
jgi:hypothetical protein